MVVQLDPALYSKGFEEPYLDLTRQFYALEMQSWVATQSCANCLSHVEERMRQEALRCEQCLDRRTIPKLQSLMLAECVTKLAPTFLCMACTGVDAFLSPDRLGDLARMYRLFAMNAEAKGLLLECLVERLQAQAEKLLNEYTIDGKKNDVQYVERMLALEDQYDRIWASACQRDLDYELRFKHTFSMLVNKSQSMAKALAGYCDQLLRGRLKGTSGNEMEERVDKIISLFRHISSKDMFESLYAYHLCNRLLSDRCISDDNERLLISRLRAECGAQYTLKFETMLKDITNSQTLMTAFALECPTKAGTPGLEVKVLTQSNWPIDGRSLLCTLPVPLEEMRQKFASFYSRRHIGRVLHWKLNLGQVELLVRLGSTQRIYEFLTTTYQAVVLTLFNDRDELGEQDIAQVTAINASDLKNCLSSLIRSKLLVGIAVSVEEGLTEQRYRLNESFVCRFARVHLPTIPEPASLLQPEVLDQVERAVEEERGFVLDATLVKILKARKRIDHNSLVADTIKLTAGRFEANVQMVRHRIEILIEKDYITRSPTERQVFLYNA